MSSLRREHNDLLRFLYACPVGLIQATADGSMTMLNPVAVQLLSPLGAAGLSMNIFATFSAFAPELRQKVEGFTADHGQICHGHRIFVGSIASAQNGRPYVLACMIAKLDSDRLMVTLEDVSEQVAQERRLKQADFWFASLLDGADDFAVIGLDSEGRIETVNASARQQTGFADADLVGMPLEALDAPDPASAAIGAREEIAFARRDGWHLEEGWCAKRDGRRFRCQRLISVRNETEANGERHISGYTLILRPTSRHGLNTADLRRRLTTDHLTGACSRAHFFEVADTDLRRTAHQGKPVSLIALDVDHFKLINDTYSHATGDIVLKAIAQACAAVLRPSDTFARIGGEEFVALMPAATASQAIETAEKMRAAVAGLSIPVGDAFLRVTTSLGCVTRFALTEVTDLMKAADRALYRAKREGRNRVADDENERAVA